MRSWQVLLLLLLFRVLSISSINNNKNNIEIMIKGNIWLHIFCERVSAQKGSMEIMSFIFHYYFTNKDVWLAADVHITLVITLPRQCLNESEDRFLFISTNYIGCRYINNYLSFKLPVFIVLWFYHIHSVLFYIQSR